MVYRISHLPSQYSYSYSSYSYSYSNSPSNSLSRPYSRSHTAATPNLATTCHESQSSAGVITRRRQPTCLSCAARVALMLGLLGTMMSGPWTAILAAQVDREFKLPRATAFGYDDRPQTPNLLSSSRSPLVLAQARGSEAVGAAGRAGPLLERLGRILLQRDYNTRMVLWGTAMLGASAGAVGVFMLLRKRALLGDVVSHASLPGIALAYIVMETMWPGTGKSLTGLLFGAALGGIAGVLATTAIRRWTRIQDDAALAIVLGVFFGFGISLFTVIQRLPGGNAAGLASFIYGKAASMTAADVQGILAVAAVVCVTSLLFFKEFTVVCFDDRYASAQGWPVVPLDLLLMALVVAVTVIGLQSVGLLLVVALLIIPATTARFWTDHLPTMVALSIVWGVTMSAGGVVVSALIPRVATGAVIVLVGTTLFALGLLFGTRRGLLRRSWLRRTLQKQAQREHLLRAIYELLETGPESLPARNRFEQAIPVKSLLPLRSWNASALRRLLRRLERHGLLYQTAEGVRLTNYGLTESRRLVRNHRLWELYLIHHADTAPAHVDRNADRIEHLLDADLLAELESKLAATLPKMRVPESPHGP